MSAYMQAGETGNTTADEANGGAKRKRDDGSGIQHRTKRNRYISIACNECKRRKIKCNGETPCQRCGNLNLDCVYSPNCCSNSFRDSAEYKQLSAQISELKEQLNGVIFRVDSLHAVRGPADQDNFQYPRDDASQYKQDAYQPSSSPQGSLPIDPALQSRPTPGQPPRIQGPTSAVFGLGLPQPNMRDAGIASTDGVIQDGMFAQKDAAQKTQRESKQDPGENTRDPIWSLSKDEALRLCDAYETDTGAMFPMLDMDRLKRHASMLFKFIDAISKAFGITDHHGPDAIQDPDTDVLKLVLAIALHVEGKRDLSSKLFSWVNKTIDSKLLGKANIKDLQILALTTLYHFNADQEALAWRIIGLTARLSLEIGLHRSDTYASLFASEHDRDIGRNLFWCIYVLDHRWNLGTRMSVAIQEEDIDPHLQKPKPYIGQQTDHLGHLTVSIDLCKMSTKCGRYVASLDSPNASGFSREQVDSLDLEITQWLDSLPTHLRLIHPRSPEFTQHNGVDPNTFAGSAAPYLRATLYLRANHLRTSIYSTIWTSTNSILASATSLSYAQSAVNIAKDTIRVMTHIHARSDLYGKRKISYDDFLLAALAAIFMAVFYAPSHFAESSREEYFQAVEFVRRLSPNSFVGKRLWKTIRGLKEIDNKIGLFPAYRNQSDQAFGAENGNSNGYRRESGQSQQPSVSPAPQLQMGQQYQPQNQNDAQRSAAMTMAGLAGHSIDESAAFGFKSQHSAQTPSSIDGSAMAEDLTNFFDAFGQYGNGASMSMGNVISGDSSSGGFGNENLFDGRGDVGVDTFGPDGRDWGANDEVLNRLLKGLF